MHRVIGRTRRTFRHTTTFLRKRLIRPSIQPGGFPVREVVLTHSLTLTGLAGGSLSTSSVVEALIFKKWKQQKVLSLLFPPRLLLSYFLSLTLASSSFPSFLPFPPSLFRDHVIWTVAYVTEARMTTEIYKCRLPSKAKQQTER